MFTITILATPASSNTLCSTVWNWNTPGESLKTKQIAQTLLCNHGGSVAEWPKRYDTSPASSFVPTTSGSGRPVFNSSASGRAAAEELNMAGVWRQTRCACSLRLSNDWQFSLMGRSLKPKKVENRQDPDTLRFLTSVCNASNLNNWFLKFNCPSP